MENTRRKKKNEHENDFGKKDDPQNGACATSDNHCLKN